MWVKGGHFMASTNSFNKHLLDVCAEVYRAFRWKRQGPDMQELKCWQTHLPPPATCGSCAVLSLSPTQSKGAFGRRRYKRMWDVEDTMWLWNQEVLDSHPDSPN